MNLILKNTDSSVEGIFGAVLDEAGNQLFVTLQHAYDSGLGNGSYAPKLGPGVYKCVRGQHQLHNMLAPFITYEITGVPGHTNILFHIGNFNKDSDGCVLLGSKLGIINNQKAVSGSHVAFDKFMALQNGIHEFTLTVEG